MPFTVYCPQCDAEDVVRTKAQADEFHGHHPTRILGEVSGIEYSAAKRGKRSSEYAESSEPTHQGGDSADPHGGTCPLCGTEYTLFLRDHLPCLDGT